MMSSAPTLVSFEAFWSPPSCATASIWYGPLCAIDSDGNVTVCDAPEASDAIDMTWSYTTVVAGSGPLMR
jgi:hypothetical protein